MAKLFVPDMSKLNVQCYLHFKNNMEPKCVIGLSLQGSKHRRSEEFGLGAAQKRNVLLHGRMFQLPLIFFMAFNQNFETNRNYLLRSRNEIPRAQDDNLLIAVAV